MKSLLVSSIAMVAIFMVTGCKGAQPEVISPTGGVTLTSPTTTISIHPTDTPIPAVTLTPAQTFAESSTVTQELPATDIPVLKPSATITPSATPDVIIPGYYNAGGCKVYNISYFLNVDFCIDQVEVLPDRSMNISVSWTYHLPFEPGIGFEPYFFYPVMGWFYLVDDFGTRYTPIEEDYPIVHFLATDGDFMTAVYTFSPPRPGARTFMLYDEEHSSSITLMLTTPVKTHEIFKLENGIFQLRYQLKYWEITTDPQGKNILAHLSVTNCTITDDSSSTIRGTLINTLDIGGITYQIYRYYEQDWSVREYLAIAGLEGIDSEIPTLLRVVIPYADAQTCILDASEVLANLQPAVVTGP